MITTSEINDQIATEIVNANGIRIEVDKCGDQSSRKLAICLHGFPEHAVSWRFQMPMLAEMGYKVWAPNLRGYGNSSMPPERDDYDIEVLMEDVGALIDAAECDETVLIAHDWGAIIAWYFAMRQVRPLTHLIICNVPHPGPNQGGVSWEQIKKSWYIMFFQIPWLPEKLVALRGNRMGKVIRDGASTPENYPEDVIRVFTENGARPGGLTAMINYYRAFFQRGGGARRQKDMGFPIIETPTLMCWGEDDIAITIETTYGTENFVPNLTIRYLPRISHWVQQDAPEEVNAMMRAFLSGEPVPYMRWKSELVSDLES